MALAAVITISSQCHRDGRLKSRDSHLACFLPSSDRRVIFARTNVAPNDTWSICEIKLQFPGTRQREGKRGEQLLALESLVSVWRHLHRFVTGRVARGRNALPALIALSASGQQPREKQLCCPLTPSNPLQPPFHRNFISKTPISFYSSQTFKMNIDTLHQRPLIL